VTVASIDGIPRSQLREQRVLVRIDAGNEANLRDSLATLGYLCESGARAIIATHCTEQSDALRFDAVVDWLTEQLHRAVSPLTDWQDNAGLDAILHMGAGEIKIVEDLAAEPGEATGDDALAEKLARLCDIYCNEAFALSHEIRASTVGVARKAKLAVAGLAFKRELLRLERLLGVPEHPLHTLLGGELSRQKLLLAEAIARRSENLFVAGAMCLPFLVAKGLLLHNPAVDAEMVSIADRIMTDAHDNKRDITLPVDYTVVDKATFERLKQGERFVFGPPVEIVKKEDLRPNQVICDIGDITRWAWRESLRPARTVCWHGPLGICEFEPFREGTRFLATEFNNRTWPDLHRSVMCGSRLTASLREMGIATEHIGYLTTAGRTALHYLAGRPLPAVEALSQAAELSRQSVRILIPLDGSETDISALAVAAKMATRESEIFLLHVRRGPDEEQFPDLLHALSKAERFAQQIESERIFMRANAILATRGLVSIDQVTVQGDPAEMILRYGKRWRVGLIALTAYGTRVIDDARHVINHATSAVLVARLGSAVTLDKEASGENLRRRTREV
jgi:phosphoglycerate kinase